MNLLQIRTQFKTESGRYDLVTATFADAGADFYVNAGQRYLDRLINTPKSVGRVFRELSVGAYYVVFPYCRAIKEVWVASGLDDSRWQLEKQTIQDIRTAYPNSWTSPATTPATTSWDVRFDGGQNRPAVGDIITSVLETTGAVVVSVLVSSGDWVSSDATGTLRVSSATQPAYANDENLVNTTQANTMAMAFGGAVRVASVTSGTLGNPLYYCPAVLRAVPETDRTPIGSLDAFLGFADVMFGEHYSYNGVLIMPPPNQALMVEVWGLFYSPALLGDAEKSYWSEAHPEVLLMAAYRQLEVVNRNSQGVKDWEKSINETLFGIDKDVVEEDIAGADQMEG